jgi:hypothetical protein
VEFFEAAVDDKDLTAAKLQIAIREKKEIHVVLLLYHVSMQTFASHVKQCNGQTNFSCFGIE